MRDELDSLSGTRGQYLVDGVVVSSFLPMRAIPFKVIFVAGLGGENFPAAARDDHLDLRNAHHRAGDISLREQDNYLFLEALLSARERFYLSYVARDELTGDSLQPSSVVLELVETLERGYVPVVSRRRLPLRRADDPATENASPSAARERKARTLGESLKLHLARPSIPEPGSLPLTAKVRRALKLIAPPKGGSDGDAATTISLSAIRRFLECPLQGSARFSLRLGDANDEVSLADDGELFQARPLERSELLRATFRARG